MLQRKFVYILLSVVLTVAILELLGFTAMYLFSRQHDFLANRNFFHIREMLLSGEGTQHVSKYLSTPYLSYIPNPGFEKNGFTQHNGSGYRGDSIPEKKGAAFRILCMGGSTTYGTGVEDPADSYPAQLKKILESSGRFPKGIEVLNAGLEAGTSAEELTSYLLKYSYYKPDLVILHSGGNDAMIDPEAAVYQPDYSHSRKIIFHLEPLPARTRWMLHSNLLSFIVIYFFYDHLLNDSRDPFVNYPHKKVKVAQWSDTLLNKKYLEPDFTNYAFYQNHRRLLKAIIEDGADVIDVEFGYNPAHPWILSSEGYRKRLAINNQIIRSLAEENNIAFCAFGYSSVSDPSSWLDDCHLDKKGEYEKAAIISDLILYLLQDKIEK